LTKNMIGPQGQFYADPQPGPDEIKFREDNTSSAYYNSPYFLAHKNQVQPIPRRRSGVALNLTDYIPQEIVKAIQAAGKISFHAVGDTGSCQSKTAPRLPRQRWAMRRRWPMPWCRRFRIRG